MLNGIRFAREHNVPYFGICLGMQTACIEFARNVCGLDEANSSEFDPATPHRVIYKLRELRGVEELGGTMRLGAWDCKIDADSNAFKAYGKTEISERHRHRYEFNREYEQLLTGAGLRITGSSPDGTYVEIVELPNHPYFLGCQFHPEFKSKPLEPHPLFLSFVHASYQHRALRLAAGRARRTQPVPPPRGRRQTLTQGRPVRSALRVPHSKLALFARLEWGGCCCCCRGAPPSPRCFCADDKVGTTDSLAVQRAACIVQSMIMQGR